MIFSKCAFMLVALLYAGAAFAATRLNYVFNNRTDQPVRLGITVRGSGGLETELLTFAPGITERRLRGCLKQVRIGTENLAPIGDDACSAMVVIYKNPNGQLDVDFEYFK